MEWHDDGIVLDVRRHGESSIVLSLLTRSHGRHHGLVKGGAGKSARGLYQPGNLVSATWKARLEEQLGIYVCELTEAKAAGFLGDPDRLAGLSAACAVAEAALPERESHPAMYHATLALLGEIERRDLPTWAAAYVEWELLLLQELGFGLDLSECAATGATENLTYVSPRTARAVSAEAGAPWREKLLSLPAFLIKHGPASLQDLRDGLRLTGYFLDQHVFSAQGRNPPPARYRLVDRIG